MKQVKRVIVFIIVILLVSGCSSNKIKCKKDENNKTSSITIDFNDDEIIKSLSLKEKIIFDELDAHIELEYYDLKNKYATLDNLKGVDYEIKENKNDITINLNVNYNTLENDNFSLITISKNTKKNVVVKNLSNIGYICKY